MEKLLANLKLHTSFENKDLQDIESYFFSERVSKGHCLLKEGQVCKKIYFVSSGCFKTYTIVDGKENVLDFFVEGDWFVELSSFVNKSPSPFYIEAIENSEFFYVLKDDFEELRTKYNSLERFYCKLLEKYIPRIINLLNDKLSISNEERYCKLIKERPDFINRIPQYLIASYLGLSPEGLSKLRRRISLNPPSL